MDTRSILDRRTEFRWHSADSTRTIAQGEERRQAVRRARERAAAQAKMTAAAAHGVCQGHGCSCRAAKISDLHTAIASLRAHSGAA
jgi:hypothetical protein